MIGSYIFKKKKIAVFLSCGQVYQWMQNCTTVGLLFIVYLVRRRNHRIALGLGNSITTF